MDRYSPTDVVLTSSTEVPKATHELFVVHATNESGTEMLIEGSPLTRGGFEVTVAGAHEAKITPANMITAATRTTERTWAGTRIIVP